MIRALLIALSLAASATQAQQPTPKRVGYFSAASASANAPRIAAFRQGMKELGWIDGKDYILDARYADGIAANVPRLAGDVVASRPDLILTPGDEGARALARVTKTIPIVFANSVDPVALGAVRSLQRPGGNVTGLSSLRGSLGGKRLELLKQAFPNIAHVSILYAGEEVSSKPQVQDIEAAAAHLRVKRTLSDVNTAGLDSAIKEASRVGCQAFVVIDGYQIYTKRRDVIDAINASRLPAVYSRVEMVEAGGLLSYAASTFDNFRRAAVYVDKIFKGANPAELPIDQPTKFDLSVNLKVAKTIGVAIPTSLLVRADKVIQ